MHTCTHHLLLFTHSEAGAAKRKADAAAAKRLDLLDLEEAMQVRALASVRVDMCALACVRVGVCARVCTFWLACLRVCALVVCVRVVVCARWRVCASEYVRVCARSG